MIRAAASFVSPRSPTPEMIDLRRCAMPFDQQTYVDAYQKANIVRVVVKLNRKTDADILRVLEAQPNRQGYIKKLIREAMCGDKIGDN